MTKKYFFFDIDGTLTTKNPGGDILPSTFRTLDALRANGHFVSIATGRAQWMAMPFAKEAGIDNLVTDGGHGLTLNNEVVFIKPLDRIKALTIIEECLEQERAFCIAKDNSNNYYSHSAAFDQLEMFGKMNAQLQVINDLDYHSIPEIHKIFVDLKVEEEPHLAAIHGDLGYARYHEDNIIIEPEDKFAGIRAMMEHLGAPLEDVVVFGDAHNDLGMMREAETGIAMGNAIPELKELATYITKNSDEDGIEYACKHFGWI